MKDNVIKTDYGYDLTWASSSEYCGKILVFEKSGGKVPFHFHKSKSKSWFVNAGKFKVVWVDTKDGKVYAQQLDEGGTFNVPALMPVFLESLADNGSITEVGSADLPEDFFRLN